MKHLFNSLIIVWLFIGFTSCKDDDSPSVAKEETDGYILMTRTTNPDGQTYGFYLQQLSDLDKTVTIDNANAEEIASATLAATYYFDKAAYLNDFMNNKIERWTLSKDNKATLSGSLNVSELGYQGNISFKDKNAAFIAGPSSPNIMIFNPTTMKKTGSINWSKYSRKGDVTDFPQKGNAIKNEGISEMIISGNHLFASVYYVNDFNSFIPAMDSCVVLVIDLNKVDPNSSDNAKAVVGLISDHRGSFSGSWNSGDGAYFMKKDEKGDVYLLCHNMWGNHRQTIGKSACILRIKKGETTFDQEYYFNLEKASKGEGNPVVNFEYYGDGKFLAAVQNPEALDPSDPYSYYVDPIFQWWSFDLYNKTATIAIEEYTKGASSAKCYFKDGYGYVPFDNNKSTYINEIRLSDFQTNKRAITSGAPVILGKN